MESDTYLVEFKTTMGNIVLELDAQAAPVTVKNFLEYVDAGFYNGTIFHRVIPGFMIQGGGLTADMGKKQTRDPIINEANNGLSNTRGTIAMARQNDPDSATCQFFINHVDNRPLDYVNTSRPGYAVFGKVIEGMDTVDAIAMTKSSVTLLNLKYRTRVVFCSRNMAHNRGVEAGTLHVHSFLMETTRVVRNRYPVAGTSGLDHPVSRPHWRDSDWA